MRWPFRRRRRVVELELPAEGVRAHLLLFARCGGRLTLSEFARLPTEVAAVLAKVQDELRAEQACLVARASSGEIGFAAVQAIFDDGAGMDETVLGAALARAARTIGRPVP